MTDITPFDARPDAELGAALREALAAPDDVAFARRMRELVLGESSWDVMARWAWPGVAAAAAALLLTSMWVGQLGSADGTLGVEQALSPEGAQVTQLAIAEPSREAVLALAMGEDQ